MTVETKSTATQLSNDHLPADEENREDEEIELTPSSGMLCTRSPLLMRCLTTARSRILRGGQKAEEEEEETKEEKSDTDRPSTGRVVKTVPKW